MSTINDVPEGHPVHESTHEFEPCLGKDCIHFLGYTTEEYVHICDTRGPDYGKECHHVWHDHTCTKNQALGDIRQEIYDRAFATSDSIYGGWDTPFSRSRLRKAHNAWEAIAEEWRQFRCPFYSPQT